MPRRLLPADGRGRHPGQRRLPVLRRLGGDAAYRSADQATYQNSAQTIGQNLRNHPSVFSFQWSDNAADQPAGDGGAHRVRRGGLLPDPLIASAEYKSSPQLGAVGGEGGPLRLGAAELLVRHHPSRQRLTVTNAGGAWGLRQRGERGQHRAHPRLAQPVHVRQRPVEPVAEHRRPTSTTSTTSHDARPATRSARCATSTPRSSSRYGAWSSLAQYVQEAQAPGLREHPGAVRGVHRPREQHAAALHRHDLLADEQGLAEPAVERCTTTTATRPAATSAPRRRTGPCTPSTRWTTARSRWTTSATPAQSGLSVEAKVYSLAGTVLDDQTASNITLASQQVLNKVLTPKVPTAARCRSTSSSCC